MANYLKTSKTVTVKDYYGSEWTQITAEVTVAAGNSDTESKVSYTVTSTNDQGGGHWHYNGVYVKIGSEVICDGSYYKTSSDFPNAHNSKKTGSFKTKSGSVKITVKVCCQQDGRVGDRWTDGTATVKSETLTRTTWTNVKKGTTTITDLFNNKFKISATKGDDGENNDASGPSSLVWGYNTKYENKYSNGATKTLTISGKGKTRTVYAKSTTTGERGTDQVATASKGIRQYIAPPLPSSVSVSWNSDRTRLTIKDNWTFSWTAPTAANTGSPIKGYRIALIKYNTSAKAWESIAIKDSRGTTISKNPTESTWHSVDTASTSFTIYPVRQNFKAGDKLKLGVRPFTMYGEDNDAGTATASDSNTGKLFSEGDDDSTYRWSSELTVQNSAIMRVKTSDNSKFVEGVVHVAYFDDKAKKVKFKEAEVVKVYSGGWKESL